MSTFRKSQMIRAVSLLYLGAISRSHALRGNGSRNSHGGPWEPERCGY